MGRRGGGGLGHSGGEMPIEVIENVRDVMKRESESRQIAEATSAIRLPQTTFDINAEYICAQPIHSSLHQTYSNEAALNLHAIAT